MVFGRPIPVAEIQQEQTSTDSEQVKLVQRDSERHRENRCGKEPLRSSDIAGRRHIATPIEGRWRLHGVKACNLMLFTSQKGQCAEVEVKSKGRSYERSQVHRVGRGNLESKAGLDEQSSFQLSQNVQLARPHEEVMTA